MHIVGVQFITVVFILVAIPICLHFNNDRMFEFVFTKKSAFVQANCNTSTNHVNTVTKTDLQRLIV